jgi:hypothetical protein
VLVSFCRYRSTSFTLTVMYICKASAKNVRILCKNFGSMLCALRTMFVITFLTWLRHFLSVSMYNAVKVWHFSWLSLDWMLTKMMGPCQESQDEISGNYFMFATIGNSESNFFVQLCYSDVHAGGNGHCKCPDSA